MLISKYLPSKRFTKQVGGIFLIVGIILFFVFGIKWLDSYVKEKKIQNKIKQLPVELQSQADTLTIGELQTKDSNGNSIPDWEERLYNLNPLTDGATNLTKVQEIRKKLKDNPSNTVEDSVKFEGKTDQFTHEFLNLVLALQQSGALDQTTINSIAQQAGTSIVPPVLPEKVKVKDLHISRDTVVTQASYYDALIDIVSKSSQAKMLGEELGVISRGLQSQNDPDLSYLTQISIAYKSVADSLLKISVPEKFAGDHRAILNSLYNISESLTMIRKMNSDPIEALQGFMVYGSSQQILNESLDSLATKQ